MLWTIVSVLLGVLALVIVVNLFTGFIKLAIGGKIFSAILASLMIIGLVYLIGWVI